MKLTNQDRKNIKANMKKLQEELDKIDWVEVRQEGEELDRLIGWRSLTVED